MKREPLAPTHEQGQPTKGDSPGATFSAERYVSRRHNVATLEIIPNDNTDGITVRFEIDDTPENRDGLARLRALLYELSTGGMTTYVVSTELDDDGAGEESIWVPVLGLMYRPDENGEPSTRNGMVSFGRVVESQYQEWYSTMVTN